MELGANPIGDVKQTDADRLRPVAAIDSHIEITRRLIVRVISEASLPFDTGLPAMITITWMRIQLGKGGEFQALAKSDLLPLMKEAGMKFFLVAQTVFGGPISDYAIFTTLASWAMIDGPREENVYRFWVQKSMAMSAGTLTLLPFNRSAERLNCVGASSTACSFHRL